MLSQDSTQIARERNIAESALTLFCSVYGLGWDDSYRAAAFMREYGQAATARILRIVSTTGASWSMALMATRQSDGETVLFTAPLRGDVPVVPR
jgi:hypothetical protein